MQKEIKKVILVGFGNEFRSDDGLGIKLLDLLEDDRINKLKVEELTFDLVEELKDFDIVIFVDAAIEGDDINFKKIEKTSKFSPLTHHMSPEELLIWCEEINKKSYEFYLLSIRGYDFDFGEEISQDGKKNLIKAKEFLLSFLNFILI